MEVSALLILNYFSSAPNTKRPEELVPNPEEAKQKLKLLWVSCSDNDGLITFSK